jgi:hypothetical protein
VPKNLCSFLCQCFIEQLLISIQIATVFETWRKNRKLNCKLEENKELKLIILAETPWISDAQSETDKK